MLKVKRIVEGEGAPLDNDIWLKDNRLYRKAPNGDWAPVGDGNDGGGSGGSAPADWSVDDPSAPGYIKNKPDLDKKQEKLVSGQNIKSINGESILGSGNIDLQGSVISSEAFPASWPKSGSIYNMNNHASDLIYAINHDDSAVAGKTYLATVSYNDLPAGMIQAEIEVKVMKVYAKNSKIVLLTVTSSNVSPWHWEYTSAYDDPGEWRCWLPTSTFEAHANNTNIHVNSEEKAEWSSKISVDDFKVEDDTLCIR